MAVVAIRTVAAGSNEQAVMTFAYRQWARRGFGAFCAGLLAWSLPGAAAALDRLVELRRDEIVSAILDEPWAGADAIREIIDEDDDAYDGPDITNPGPDLGDFPNSAATLPRGRVYLEMAPLTLAAADRNSPGSYSWPFLLRYGVTDDVEFRLLGSGLASVWGSEGTTGFAPLSFDMKVHLWDEQPDSWIPASSLEVILQTDWASPAFQGGTQPSINLNFDLPLTERTTLEWTIGYSGVQEVVDVVTGEVYVPILNYLMPVVQRTNLSAYQFSFQWAIERKLTERFQVFVHGYYNGPILLQQGPGDVVGLGFFWTHTQRLMWFGSCNAGLDDNVAPVSGQIGLALAF